MGRLLLILILAFVSSCKKEGSKDKHTVPKKVTIAADGKKLDALWALALNGTTNGLVISEQAWRQSEALRQEVVDAIESLPAEFALEDQHKSWLRFIRNDAPSQFGIDVSKGFALFNIPTPSGGEGDLALFATTSDAMFKEMGLTKEGTHWSDDSTVCIEAQPYSGCVNDDEGEANPGWLKTAMDENNRAPFVAATKERFAKTGRGHIELAMVPDDNAEVSRANMVILVGPGRVHYKAEMDFRKIPEDFPFNTIKASTFQELRQDASTYAATALNQETMGKLASDPVLGFARNLTGEMAMAGHGRATTVAAKAMDQDGATEVAQAICSLVKMGAASTPMAGLTYKDTPDGCNVTIGMAPTPDLKEASIRAKGDMVQASWGVPPKSSGKTSQPLGAAGLLERDGIIIARLAGLHGITLSPMYGLIKTNMPAEPRKQMARVLHFASRVFDVGGVATLDNQKRMFIEAQVNLFSQDSPEVYQDYLAAMKKAGKGQTSTAKDMLKDIAEKHPNTLAGRAHETTGMGAAAVAGMITAVAIPSFVKYSKPAKASEFDMNLRTIAEGAIVAYETPKATPNGLGFLPKGFPKAVAQTPSVVTCDKKNPANSDWSQWNDLKFSIPKPFLGHYGYKPSPSGDSFTAWVEYDVDCDGQIGRKELKGIVVGGEVELGSIVETKAD